MKKYIYLLSLLMFAMLLTSCGSEGAKSDSKTINGTWIYSTQGYVAYLQIQKPNYDVYDKEQGIDDHCYEHSSAKIHKVSGDKYKLSNSDETATLRVSNDILTVTTGNDVTTFKRSNADVSQFEICN